MQHYRLLRNNKESGPYTWKELAHLPLKPYDLVWVDGKSAAWRYASELPEFKELAPAVEEDFYQLFHKSPAEKSTEALRPVAAKPINVPADSPGKKRVAVILPEQAAAPKKEPATAPAPVAAPVPEKRQAPVVVETAVQEELLPADPVIDQLQKVPRQQKSTTAGRILPKLGWAVVVAGLAIVGFRWMTSNTNQTVLQENNESALPVIQTTQSNTDEELPAGLPSNPALEFAALKRHLSVRPDQINVGMFGGISRLVLSVRNDYGQPLEGVTIAVDFLEKDQSLHHTEIVQVKRIDAQTTISLPVHANGKGRAVQTRIIGIGDAEN